MTSTNYKLIGRILYAVPFFVFGIYRFFSMDFFIGLTPEWVPFPEFWISLVGVGLVAASISIVTGKLTQLACVMLAGMIIALACSVHFPNMVAKWDDPAARSIFMAMGIKDIALSGSALIIAGVHRRKREVSQGEFLVHRKNEEKPVRVSA